MPPAQPARPRAVASQNIRFVGHSDQGGRGNGVQVMVHRGHAYIGHTFSNGITIVDVRDPARPKTVEFIACPPNTRTVHLQIHDDLLLAVNAQRLEHAGVPEPAGLFRGSPADKLRGARGASRPASARSTSPGPTPAEIGFMPVEGFGPHRIWYTGGRYAYASIHFSEFTDHVLAVIDVSDPEAARGRRPVVDSGMWRGGAETPTWRNGRRFALHHAFVAGTSRMAPGGTAASPVLDVADPTQPS